MFEFPNFFSIYLSHPVACCTIYDSQLCSAEMETVSHILSSTHILFYHLWRHLSSPLASKENNFAAIHMKCCKDCFLKFLNPLGFVEFYGLRLVIFVFMYSCKQMSKFFKFLWSAGARNQLMYFSVNLSEPEMEIFRSNLFFPARAAALQFSMSILRDLTSFV